MTTDDGDWEERIAAEGLDPAEVDRAKQRAAGDLGRTVADYPGRFVVPVTFGENPATREEPVVNTGSISLLKLDGHFGVTCRHVIEKYRTRLAEDDDMIFQVGNEQLDPLDLIIAESAQLDLAVLDLSGAKSANLTIEDKEEVWFIEPPRWPPYPVSPGEFVTLAGYPADWRRQPAGDEVEHGLFSLGSSMVTSVSKENISCAFEREYWVQAYGPEVEIEDLSDLGGMSGSPVFIHRDLAFHFVGIVHDHLPSLDLMRVRPGRFIRADGSLEEW